MEPCLSTDKNCSTFHFSNGENLLKMSTAKTNVLSMTELNAVKHLRWYVNYHTSCQCHCCCSHCHHHHHHHQKHDQHHQHHQCHCCHKHQHPQHYCAVRKFGYFMPCCGRICLVVSSQKPLISYRYNDYIERETVCVCVCLCVCVCVCVCDMPYSFNVPD